MSRLTLIFSSIIIIFFLLVSCTNNTVNSTNSLSEENETVEVIFEEQQISLSASNYEDLTEDAIYLYESVASPHNPKHQNIKKWFIRYYIQMHEYNEPLSNEDLLKLAKERHDYEEAWKNYANEEYSVKVSNESLESQAAENFIVYQNNLPPSVSGMSNGLDLTIEEFMLEFDLDHVERSAIWQQLMPLLLEEYQGEEDQRLDNVYLRQLYEEEVTDYLEDQEKNN